MTVLHVDRGSKSRRIGSDHVRAASRISIPRRCTLLSLDGSQDDRTHRRLAGARFAHQQDLMDGGKLAQGSAAVQALRTFFLTFDIVARLQFISLCSLTTVSRGDVVDDNDEPFR